MTIKYIPLNRAAFIKHDLENGGARQQKVALQDLAKLYRSDFQLRGDQVNGIEKLICGIVLSSIDRKVVRWCLNCLAQLGRFHESKTYVELALRKHEGDPEICAAAIAALSHLYRGNLDSSEAARLVPPTIRTLAALQNTDPSKLDLTDLQINIETADEEVLKLALITIGLNKDIEHLFHPKHANGDFVRHLGQHPNPIVRQYSVWCVTENEKLTIADLGIPFENLEREPGNVQSKLLQLAAERESDKYLRHSVIERGTFLPDAEARIGLAKGLKGQFYDGLEDISLGWYKSESSDSVRELIAEHFARFADDCPPYEDRVFEILHETPHFRPRVLLGAEGKPIYGRIRSSDVREGTADMFGDVGYLLPKDLTPKERPKVTEKVLVLSSSPVDEDRLRLDEEARELRNRLKAVKNPSVEIIVENVWAVRTNDIQAEVVSNQPSVLHFSGHGNSGILCFEDRNGNAAPVSDEALAELVGLVPSIRCLVLGACYSDTVAATCSPNVDCVVGCDSSIDDDAGIAFSYAFYSALARGESYANAFRFGRNEVRLNCASGEADKFKFTQRRS